MTTLAIRPPRTAAWQDHASCREVDPELWFPEKFTTADGRQKARQARQICHRCPVRRPCLRTAMAEEGNADARHREGVQGGLTPGQRAELYRALQARQAP